LANLQKPMIASKSYHDFLIEIRPSPETDDHEVRFLAEGEDIIAKYWKVMMGLDPDDILVEPCPLRCGSDPHRATIARCGCGVIGCGSVEVEVVRSRTNVEWRWGSPDSTESLKFLARSYDSEVERALNDTSWETPDRTAARLLAGKVDRKALGRYGLSYSWASGRIHERALTVSLNLEPGPYQVLVHLPWHAESPSEIARLCAEMLGDKPANWAQVEWFPQRHGLGPPALANAHWRQGGA
jgi:hypothetical protein